MDYKCKTCLKEFRLKYNGQKFCSSKCYWSSLKVRGEKPKCHCGKILTAHNCKMCKPCYGKYRSGVNHFRYMVDRNQLKKSERKDHDSRYKEWMLEVKNRDGWKCKISNIDCKGHLEAHHILTWREYPELRYDINNGITLCQAHHPRKRAEEKRLSPYFKELVSVSK